MTACPSCGRPVALVQQRCLYCGAPLPEGVLAEAQTARQQALAEEQRPREALPALVLDLRDAAAADLAAALGSSLYDARVRIRRGGLSLWRMGPLQELEALAARLANRGVRSYVVPGPELDAARQPQLARGLAGRPDGLDVELEDGSRVSLQPADCLLVVRGTVVSRPAGDEDDDARNRSRTAERAAMRAALLSSPREAPLVHLHLVAAGRPLEIDPGELEFGSGGPIQGSSLLALQAVLDGLRAAGVGQDDGFRYEVPALGPSRAARPGRGAALARAGGRAPAQRIDNVGQFRAYSAWRGAAERMCRR